MPVQVVIAELFRLGRSFHPCHTLGRKPETTFHVYAQDCGHDVQGPRVLQLLTCKTLRSQESLVYVTLYDGGV